MDVFRSGRCQARQPIQRAGCGRCNDAARRPPRGSLICVSSDGCETPPGRAVVRDPVGPRRAAACLTRNDVVVPLRQPGVRAARPAVPDRHLVAVRVGVHDEHHVELVEDGDDADDDEQLHEVKPATMGSNFTRPTSAGTHSDGRRSCGVCNVPRREHPRGEAHWREAAGKILMLIPTALGLGPGCGTRCRLRRASRTSRGRRRRAGSRPSCPSIPATTHSTSCGARRSSTAPSRTRG